MPNYICKTCGVQFAETLEPPESCPICNDERQYVGHLGQRWTTLEELKQQYHNELAELEPGLTAITIAPKFAIGQRALLVQTSKGNVLWDCHSLPDERTISTIQALGGVEGIAIGHPHFYDSMVAWSHALGHVPVHLHAADREHVMRPDPVIHYWDGESFNWLDGITLIRCGGHFAGSSVLHWAQGADRRGVLLTGDTIYVVADRRWVSFMRSYPNLIPLPASAVRRIVAAVTQFQFDRIYGGWESAVIVTDGKAIVARSAERYIRAIQD